MDGVDPSFSFGHLRDGKPVVKPIHEWIGFSFSKVVVIDRDM